MIGGAGIGTGAPGVMMGNGELCGNVYMKNHGIQSSLFSWVDVHLHLLNSNFMFTGHLWK